MSTIYLILQGIIVLCVLAPINWLQKALTWFNNATNLVRGRVTRHIYYPIVIRRRRTAGEPEWKEIDWLHLGIAPPEGHPYWAQMPPLIPVPEDRGNDNAA